MLRLMLRSKIHRATVTDSNLEYEGSLTVDPDLIEAAGMLPYEQVSVSNLNNGERFETYVIPGKRGSGELVLNGPTARKGAKGALAHRDQMIDARGGVGADLGVQPGRVGAELEHVAEHRELLRARRRD